MNTKQATSRFSTRIFSFCLTLSSSLVLSLLVSACSGGSNTTSEVDEAPIAGGGSPPDSGSGPGSGTSPDEATLASSFVNFESPQTQPLRISPDGSRLFVVNTPDARLSVFNLSNASSPDLMIEIPVAIDPVSVYPINNNEAWVVSSVADSISVVSVEQGIVIDTLYIEDEPSDIVVAGSPAKAFVSLARSNQIAVFDVATRSRLSIIDLQGEHPRSLLVSANGESVYASFTLSGNRTTILHAEDAPYPPQSNNPQIPEVLQQATIIRADDDAYFGSVNSPIQFTVLDHDVVEIDVQSQQIVRYIDDIGTVNFGMTLDPRNNQLYVANTEALNLTALANNLRGHFVDNRISKVAMSGEITHYDLNAHVNYQQLPNEAARSNALAQPTGVQFDSNLNQIWVTAYGSDRIARLTTNGAIEARININTNNGTMRGPRAFASAPNSHRLYVQNSLSNTISIINTSNDEIVAEVPVGTFDPTPEFVRYGRQFLYSANLSGNGTASCASCHIDGEDDHLSWNLGDSEAGFETSVDPETGTITQQTPMKGPMVTLSLKGLKGIAPLHWRGDRQNFLAFNPTFNDLMGGSPLSESDMQAFSDYIDSLQLSANPNLNLDGSYPNVLDSGDPRNGEILFRARPNPTGNPNIACADCHTMPGEPTRNLLTSQVGSEEIFRVPNFKNFYKKSNMSRRRGSTSVNGFGAEHSGAVDVTQLPIRVRQDSNDMIAFMNSFDTGTPTITGYARTINAVNMDTPEITRDWNLLEAEASSGRCDLIVHGRMNNEVRGLLFNAQSGSYQLDRRSDSNQTRTELVAGIRDSSNILTFMCAPVGTGHRLALDRNLDGLLNRDN